MFLLETQTFHRDFDFPARNIPEQQKYLLHSDTYIAYDSSDKPVGYFALKKEADTTELLVIVVLPEKQGQGVGQAMMKKVQELAKGTTMKLVTHPKNSTAVRFYLRAGFEIYGWKDNYFGDGQPRLLLSRTLGR